MGSSESKVRTIEDGLDEESERLLSDIVTFDFSVYNGWDGLPPNLNKCIQHHILEFETINSNKVIWTHLINLPELRLLPEEFELSLRDIDELFDQTLKAKNRLLDKIENYEQNELEMIMELEIALETLLRAYSAAVRKLNKRLNAFKGNGRPVIIVNYIKRLLPAS